MEAEGRKSIARSDAARGACYKSSSGREWGDPRQYELSVDSSIGPERTAALIYSYISQGYRQRAAGSSCGPLPVSR